jgi:integrase
METGVLAVRTTAALTGEDFARLADVPPEAEWFANLTNPNTRRAYKSDVRSFMAFLGISQRIDLRRVVRAHVLAWRKAIVAQAPATVRRKLAAVSSLFDYLCDRNAVPGNPVSSIQRPKESALESCALPRSWSSSKRYRCFVPATFKIAAFLPSRAGRSR